MMEVMMRLMRACMKELVEMTHLAFDVAMVGELCKKYSRTYLNKLPYRIP